MFVFRVEGYLKTSQKWTFNNERLDIATYSNYLDLNFISRPS